eukprot:1486376-Prymnesium_polylepis.1
MNDEPNRATYLFISYRMEENCSAPASRGAPGTPHPARRGAGRGVAFGLGARRGHMHRRAFREWILPFCDNTVQSVDYQHRVCGR